MFRKKVIEEPKEIKPLNNNSPQWYNVKVTPEEWGKESYSFKVKTDDLKWTMKQHLRNKPNFIWEKL
tara:strand:- start:47 stop:247 length:201 start_codon:yes stop_codon:yes gene_type:complete